MSTSQRPKRNAKLPETARPGQRPPRLAAALLIAAIVTVGAYGWSKRSHTDNLRADTTTATVQATNTPAAVGTPNPALAKLQGKWLRPDGGYILEIHSVGSDGNLDAAYFNPKSIHVAKAVGFQESGSVKVFVELRDLNYPGSTYTLIYDPKEDQLRGDYFQAALKQTFDVYFTRVRP